MVPVGEGAPGAGIPWFSAGEPSFCWVHLLSMKEAGAAGIKRRAGTPQGLSTRAADNLRFLCFCIRTGESSDSFLHPSQILCFFAFTEARFVNQ